MKAEEEAELKAEVESEGASLEPPSSVAKPPPAVGFDAATKGKAGSAKVKVRCCPVRASVSELAGARVRVLDRARDFA